jgi:dipeptidyl aminopeptidase/acylaminoacyl peptidase
MKRVLYLGLTTILLALPGPVQARTVQRHSITFEDLMKFERISDPQVSPDGRSIVFVVGTVNLDANKQTTHIWLVPTAGGEPRQLTQGDASDSRPRWAPDGRSIAFLSTRGGSSQVWLLPTEGGEPHALTSIPTGADSFLWAAHGAKLVFTSNLYPDCHSIDDCNGRMLKEAEQNPGRGQVIDHLLFRHWNAWRDSRYTHLLVAPAVRGEAQEQDLTPGPYDSPTFFLGAPDGYDVSPDGSQVCYTSNHSGVKSGHFAAAWTTDNHLYLGPTSPIHMMEGEFEVQDITPGVHGSDASPQYSPNGRYIAYTSQEHNGYESDLFRLFVYDRQTRASKNLTEGFDQWVESFAWAPDNDTLYFIAPERAEQPIFKTSVSHPHVEKVLDGHYDELSVTPDGRQLVFSRTTLTAPSEVYRASTSGSALTPITHLNDALLGQLDMNPPEFVYTPGALGASIENLIVKPPHFDAKKKYPGLLLVHGGPQGAWEDAWGYRWNAEMFAAPGHVVMMTNFHGSTGYGQSFVEEISGDWGGAPYEDLMKATDHLASLPYVDGDRLGAAGASFGGYMIDWIAGHTQRFKALVSHDGVYDNRSMYGETEELWFPEWELKGVPWDHSSLYEKWSPSNFVRNIQTPMLLVEGGHDFRIPEGQAFQLFTALQRRGVPSRLLYFPAEGHWVLKPQDSQLWYAAVREWLDRYLQP